MKIIYSPKCLVYSTPGHFESTERVGGSADILLKQYETVKPEPCNECNLLLAHTRRLVDSVKSLEFFDPDTPRVADAYEYARLSAGGAVMAASLALGGESSFSLMRPPGHHAGKDFLGGFCYFNNIATAVKWLQKQGVGKVAICDFDVHHGNGTQDIFLGDSDVLYVSLHQSPLYPGTGRDSQGNCFNFPLPAGTAEKEYLETFKKALQTIKDFRPEILAVSAGFDAYKGDPLAGLKLEVKTYRKIGSLISLLHVPVLSVLEGGYSRMLGRCIESYLEGIGRATRSPLAHRSRDA